MAGPQWKGMLNKTIAESMKQDKDSISYPFSTIGPDGGPKVRFILHRGFVNERRKEEDPSSNPIGDEKDGLVGECLLSTTDVRGPKAQQLTGSSDKVEIAWWFAPTGDQYRITGRAFILPRPDHPLHKQFQEHAKRLAPPMTKTKEEFDWESERRRIFEKLSPAIRASFCRPIPGTPLAAKDRQDGGKDYDPNDWPVELKMDGDKELIEQSLSNFSLIVIEPFVVDWCQLNEQPNKREVYRKDTSTGEWSSTAVAP